MHIAEGVLAAPVLAAGAALTAGGVAVGLRRMGYEEVPKVAVLGSAFFVASLIHVPVGPSSVHLVLNGLAGLILGWSTFPALLVALLLQSVLFGFGGLTALGVNTLNMALPGVICYLLFSRALRARSDGLVFGVGFVAGALAIMLACLMVGISLFASGKEFLGVAKLVFVAHIPVMVIEGLVTGSAIVFLHKVRPELLPASARMRAWKETADA